MSQKTVHRINKSDLVSLLNKNDCEILREVNRLEFGFVAYLEKNLYATDKDADQILEILLEIISRVCSIRRSSRIASLDRFLRMLEYCNKFLFEDALRLINTCVTAVQNLNLVKLMFNYMNILKTLLRKDFFPPTEILNKAFPMLENYMNTLQSRRLNLEDANNCFRELKQQVDRCENPSDSEDQNDEEEDLNIKNFRLLSIVPRSNELINYEMYNIPQNIVDGPYKSVDHYLSVYYRLTREDMLRAFRACIKVYISPNQNSNFDTSPYYKDVFIDYPPEYSAKGIMYKIKFVPSRSVDWSKKAYLIPGSLVFLTADDFRSSVVMATIQGDVRVSHSKSKDCRVTIKLEDDLYREQLSRDTCYVMIEPTAYFECYRHVLSAIKEFTEKDFPLADIISYLDFEDPVPEYMYEKKYCLHEKCDAAGEHTDDCSCKVFDPLKDDEWPTSDDLGLDEQQYSAFKLALTKKVAVIQGPPGTGKTYIGAKVVKALLRNVPHTPIVICCLTNHALDQFLERMLGFTKKIIRLGSQSKSSVLEPHKLDNLMAAIVQFHMNKDSGIECVDSPLRKSLELVRKISESLLYQRLEDMEPAEIAEIRALSRDINYNLDLYVLCQEKYLEEAALNQIIDMKFKKQLRTVSGSIPKSLSAGVMEWLVCSRSGDFYNKCLKMFSSFRGRSNQPSPPSSAKDIWSLPEKKRYELFYLWREKCSDILKKNIERLTEEYRVTMIKSDFKTVKSTKLELLKCADIVGVTSTGACKFKDMLQLAGPRIFVIEEAAQVLESHIIASLTRTTQHLIMIGDHEQLRPLPCDDELSKRYKLSISMFERLFINDAPSATLIMQHRMKPCIAELLVPIPYKEYTSFKNVYEYEEIRGVESSVFFFDHRELEDENSLGTSSSNDFEAQMIVALAKYFVFCLYPQKEITILATYAAQYILIRKYLEEQKLDEIHATTVDNFQGEENEIVLISFVRSNNVAIGFLKESNRVCVALSRAKKGMFCFGNFQLYAKKNEMWKGIVEKLQNTKMIGDALPLKCFRHGIVQRAKNSGDIFNFLGSGCSEKCNSKLKCEHTCSRKCHFNDPDHKFYLCREPCNKMIDEVRVCPRLCFEKCKRVKKAPLELPCGHFNTKIDAVCQEEVQKFLPCKHLVTIPCHVDEERYQCKKLVDVNLKCGHKKSVYCYLQGKTKNVKCSGSELQVSPCGHTVEVPCGDTFEGDDLLSFCKKACKMVLNCGHPCLQLCRICFESGIHGFCTEKCDSVLSCGHKCDGYCGSPCPPCRKKCFLSCTHNTFCINECLRPCVQCVKPCDQECIHGKCSNLCWEECDVKPCSEPCSELLPCEHKCVGICGNPCPSLCRICDPESFTNDEGQSLYIELECEHVVDVALLDDHIEICLISWQWPNCPVCSEPIRKSVRFKGKLKKAKKKAIISCETSEEISNVLYLVECMYGVESIVPAQFKSIHKEIIYALKRGNLQADALMVLKNCIMILKKLVNIAPHLLEENIDDYFQKKFVTVMLWIHRHLTRASFQQLSELETAVKDLCNAVSSKSSSILRKI